MELKFINQVVKANVFMALFFTPICIYFFSLNDALGFLAGAIWGSVNLAMIKNLVQSILPFDSSKSLKILMIMGVKFPILYFVGFLLLAVFSLPPMSVLLGFSLLLIVIFINFLRCYCLTKPAMIVGMSILSTSLFASDSEGGKTPELPNIFTFIRDIFGTPWAYFLHQWESIIFSIITAAFISLVFYFGTKNRSLMPTPFQNFLEWLVENLRRFILEVLGPKGEKYVPFLGTLFLYILTMNWLVLIPFMKPPSSNINITIALAICVFCLVQYLNIKNMGLRGFIFHMAGSPKNFMGWLLVPLMFPIELLTQFTRPVTLALRLFGNVFGEDILIGAFALFGVMALSFISLPVGLPLQIPFMFLALLTGLMQAMVFTMLSTIYILLSEPSSEH